MNQQTNVLHRPGGEPILGEGIILYLATETRQGFYYTMPSVAGAIEYHKAATPGAAYLASGCT